MNWNSISCWHVQSAAERRPSCTRQVTTALQQSVLYKDPQCNTPSLHEHVCADEVLGQEAERTRARLKRIRATHADAVRQIRMEHERELGAVDIRVRKLIAAKDADIAALQRSLDTLTRALTSDVS